MGIPYYLSLNNEFEHGYLCFQKSIEAFDETIKRASYPSRFNLISLLVQDSLISTGYILKKLGEIAWNVFNILRASKKELSDIDLKNWSDFAGLVVIQALIPFICTAIRICSTISGFFSPGLAVYGWKFAENLESLSYVLWVNTFQKHSGQHHNGQVCAEIEPSNANFYLGKSQTYQCLKKEEQHLTLEVEIIAIFSVLLQAIALNDRNCFNKLLHYHKAIDSKIHMGKEYSCYSLNHDVKNILSELASPIPKQGDNLQEFIRKIEEELDIEKIEKLFEHIDLNLQRASLEDQLNFDSIEIQNHSIQLRDLFSLRFRFGRAHFSQSLNGIHISSSD